MKVIAVTGTPGTGKTTLAKKLAEEFDYLYIDVDKLITKNKLYEGYDRNRQTKIVDIKKLNKKLIEVISLLKNKINIEDALLSRQTVKKTLKKENIKKNITKIKNIKKHNGIIIDSHLSHYLPKKYVDLCIVTKCDIKVLNKRLKSKKFSKNKITENLQAEIFGVCYDEARQKGHKVTVINTTKGFNINKIARIIGG